MKRSHWWILAGLAAIGVWYIMHNSCPGCQGRWRLIAARFTGTAGAREPGGGQRLGDVAQYVVSPN